MKKLVLTAIVALFSFAAHAQAGKFSLGLQAAYPTEFKGVGVGVKGSLGITEAVRVQAAFDYYFEKDYTKAWDLNADVHYLFSLSDNFKLYPLAGLTYFHASTEASLDLSKIDERLPNVEAKASKGYFGANLGGGLQFNFTESLALNVEAKYQIIDVYDQAVISAGLSYSF